MDLCQKTGEAGERKHNAAEKAMEMQFKVIETSDSPATLADDAWSASKEGYRRFAGSQRDGLPVGNSVKCGLQK